MAENNNRLSEEYLDKDHSEEEDEEFSDDFEKEYIENFERGVDEENMVEERFDDEWLDGKRTHARFDNFFVGLLGAVLLTLITIRLVTYAELPDLGFSELLRHVYESANFQGIMITAMVPNLILFFIMYKLERWNTNYGVVVASLLITAFIFLHIV